MIKAIVGQGYRFGEALEELQKEDGYKYGIRLLKWNEDVVIRVQRPDEYSKMTAPYLYVESRFGRVPWIPTQIEIFSDEWSIAVVGD